MRALRFEQFGPPSVLAMRDLPRPVPGPGQALVRVQAAAVHRSDVKIVAGLLPGVGLPRTPGRDFCGVVVDGTQHVGQEVWSSGAGGLGITRDGAHAEFVVLPEAALSLKPPALSLAQTAAIGLPFITAWFTLMDSARLATGETVLIVGAAGAVGQAAVQVANWRGARVLGAGMRTRAIPGADVTFDTTTDDLREAVFEATHGRGVDVVLDTVGGAMFEPALRSLRVGGRHVAIASTGERRVSFDLAEFYHNGASLIGVDTLKLSPRQIGRIAGDLRAGFDALALRPPAIRTTPFDQAAAAFDRVASGEGRETEVLVFP